MMAAASSRKHALKGFQRSALGFLVSLLGLGLPANVAAAASLKGQLHLVPGVEDYRLLVKFRASAGPVLEEDGTLNLLSALPGAALPKRAGRNLKYRPAVGFTPVELGSIRARAEGRQALPKQAAGEFDILDFAGLVYLDHPGASKEELLALGMGMESREDVEYAVLEPVAIEPPPVDLAPPTPDLTARQGYLGPNPGIDCKYAWSIGIKGKGVRVSDIEHSWGDMNHEDLQDHPDLKYGLPKSTDEFKDHGIAIWGILFAQHNGYGMDGCVPEASGRGYSVLHGRPNALIRATADSKPGDVILLEMQTGGPDGKLGPADINMAVWDATRAATQSGRLVVGTAGNGGADLDSPPYASYRARGDNGVIMEGAGSADTRHVHLSYSTFGALVHVQGWGQNVASTGYGALARYGNDALQTYTSSFSGTSSGGGIVAAAVASVQSYAIAKLGRPLAPREMRELLVTTGTPQGPGNHVGPLPNIRGAIQKLMPTVAARPGADLPYQGPDILRQGRNLLVGPLPYGDFRLEIRDPSGRIHFRESWNGVSAGSSLRTLDLSRLPGGLHFLSLRWKGGSRTTKLAL